MCISVSVNSEGTKLQLPANKLLAGKVLKNIHFLKY